MFPGIVICIPNNIGRFHMGYFQTVEIKHPNTLQQWCGSITWFGGFEHFSVRRIPSLNEYILQWVVKVLKENTKKAFVTLRFSIYSITIIQTISLGVPVVPAYIEPRSTEGVCPMYLADLLQRYWPSSGGVWVAFGLLSLENTNCGKYSG